MTSDSLLPLLVVLSSFLAGVVIFSLEESRVVLRSTLNLAGAVAKLVFVGYMLWGVLNRQDYTFRHTVLPGFDLVLNADALAMLDRKSVV